MYLSASPRTQVVSAHQSAVQTPPATVAATAVPVSVPNCIPLASKAAAALYLTGAPAGVSLQNDAPTPYRIYGNTASDLRTQMQQCAPSTDGSASTEFAGQTDYYLDWQYAAVETGAGCSLTDVKVGLHTTITLPYWQPTANAAPGLAGRWRAFINGLTTHEQGHVAIDKTYAADLYQSLENLGTVPCSAVATDVQAIASSNSAAANSANDAYDAATNHGATQGAAVPTY